MKEKFARYPGLENAYRQLEYAHPEPNEVVWNIGRSIMDEDGLQPALKGFKTPAQALHKAAKKINLQQGGEAGSPWMALILLIVIVALSALGLIAKFRKPKHE